ncbi:MAG: PEP-CTERM sorting domain-containing protein [Planctomycetaceae bacterium]
MNDIGQFKVDGNGDSYYTTCPEPATYVTALLAVGLFTVRGSLRHLTRKNT